jgi:hypothetical protein
MAITFRSASHVASANTSTVVGTLPTGALSTSVLIAWVFYDGVGGSLTGTPAGWTAIDASVSGNPRSDCRWALGSVAAFTWTFSASTNNQIQILAYDGVDNSSPIGAHSIFSQGFTAISTTAITVPTANWFLALYAAYTTSATTWSTPSGLTPRDSTTSLAAFDSNAADAGSITASSTATPDNGALAQAVALSPTLLSRASITIGAGSN